jgi:hypothetical protein
MFGQKELDKLALGKQVLVAESDLNRLTFQAELQNLRSATAWVSEAPRWPRKLGPLLMVLAPLAGFLLTRASRRSDSWFSRLAAAAKWAGPLYTLWTHFSASRTKPESAEPAA